MKFRHRVFLKVGALILVLSAMAGITSFAAADGGDPRYEAEVGGVTKILTPGMEVMQGTPLSVQRQLLLPVGDDYFCRFTSLSWPRC